MAASVAIILKHVYANKRLETDLFCILICVLELHKSNFAINFVQINS